MAEFKLTDFAMYNGFKTVDTVSGKMVNAFVNLVTKEYYKSHERMRNLISVKSPDTIHILYFGIDKSNDLYFNREPIKLPEIHSKLSTYSYSDYPKSKKSSSILAVIEMDTKSSKNALYKLQNKLNEFGIDSISVYETDNFDKDELISIFSDRVPVNDTFSSLPPPAPAAPQAQLPAPPPPPVAKPAPPATPSIPQTPTPADIINNLKENNGTAYYNGKKISYDAALSLMIEKKDLHILLNENKEKGNPDLIIKDN